MRSFTIANQLEALSQPKRRDRLRERLTNFFTPFLTAAPYVKEQAVGRLSLPA